MSKDQSTTKVKGTTSTTQWGVFFFIIGFVCLCIYFWCKSEVRTDDFDKAIMLQNIANVFSFVALSLMFGSLPMIFGKAETLRVILTLIILGAFVPIVPLVVGFIFGALTLIANLLIGAITIIVIAIVIAIFGGGGGEIIAILFIRK